MWRGTTQNISINYLSAKLDGLMMSDKAWPHFVISKWNRDTSKTDVICESCTFIEWQLVDLSVEDGEYEWKKTKRIIFDLLDDEWNNIRWRIWYWPTVRKVIMKLCWPKKINKVRFSCGRYSMDVQWKTKTWNYVTVRVDWEKRDDPFDFEKDIKPKRRAIVDPETNEFIKYNDTALDDWIFNELLPSVQIKVKDKPIATDNPEDKEEEAIKEAMEDRVDDEIPF